MEPYEDFNPDELVIMAYMTKPASGWGPNKIPQGIRAIHLPTGTVVTCETERSQYRNRHLALTELWQKVQGKPSYAELQAQIEQLREAEAYFKNGMAELQDYIDKMEPQYDELKAQLEQLQIAAAEIKAQAVIDAIDAHRNRVMTFGFDTAIRVNDLIKYANRLRLQAKE